MKKIVLICILVCCRFLVCGQLCTGSLGDPIINITFGNIAAPLPYGTTNMTYITSGCPQDGSYTITNATNNCFNGTWFSIPTDHTGDKNGQFMLINASFTPSDFYVDTVKGLCGNTTYEFATWVANMLVNGSCGGAGIKPNLTFRIETTAGKVLVQYESGDIQASSFFQWLHYGTFFTTPANVGDLILRITNNAIGGCGNDLALDDITFRPCGPTLTSAIRNQSVTTINICDDNTQTYSFDATASNGFAGSTIQWQLSTDSGKTWKDISGAQSASYTRSPTVAGSYQYRLVSADAANFSSVQCRVASNIITVNVNANPVFVSKPSVTGCLGSDLLLTTVQGINYTYQWSGPNAFSSSVYNTVIPKIKYSDSGLYRVLVTTAAGCAKTDSFPVHVYPNVTAKVSADILICEGASTQLTASGGTVYSWTPVTGLSNTTIASPIASPADTTHYELIVSSQFGCKDSAFVTVNVFKNPVVNAGPDKTVFEGQSVQLDGSITGNETGFYWSPNTYINNIGNLTPLVNPPDSITYGLYVLPGQGCPAVADYVFVKVYRKITVPNVFSPNGDGIYDTWIIKGIETYPDAITHVYTRTGTLVFQCRSAGAVWDGTYNGSPVPVATYYYTIDLKIGSPVLSGWVVVLR